VDPPGTSQTPKKQHSSEWESAMLKKKNKGSSRCLTNCRGSALQGIFAQLTSAVVAA